MQISADWLVKLDDDRCNDPALVGGKAFQLHRLIKAGFPVPDAWVLTRQAFDAHLPAAKSQSPPARPTLQALLHSQLQQAAQTLCGNDDQYLAVRSSALGEDGVDHSFAGQHATYYYVQQDNLDKAVVDCWLSLWSEAASAYRSQVPTADAEFGMPVIIQIMVQAQRSGVCFTRDPTGQHPDQLLLEATWGLGAALVDGRVSPDRYRLDANLELCDQQIGAKRLKVTENLADPHGARLEPVPAQQQRLATLNALEIRQVAELAQRAETLFGSPQDLEWAMQGDTLYVLQSRPITALPASTAAERVTGRWVIFKPIVENLSEALTPLTADLFRRVLPPIGEFIEGRYYLNVDLLQRLLPLKISDDELQEALLLRPSQNPAELDWRKLPRVLSLFVLGYLATGIDWHRTARAPLERLSDYARRCQKIGADDNMDPLSTLSTLFLNSNPLAPISELAFQVNISAGRYMLLTAVLSKLLNRWAPGFDVRKLSLLTSGGEEMISQQMVASVQQLAQTAQSDETLKKALLESEVPDFNDLLGKLPEDHPFVVGFTDFLIRFGHRAIREVELMTPRWREDPATPLQMIRNYLKPGIGEQQRVDPYGLRLATEDELHQALPARWQRWLVDRLLSRIRYYVTARENTRYYHTMAFATVRARLKQWETRLIDAQRLRCVDDIFFMHWPELSALEAGALDWRDVESLIQARRRRYRRQCEVPAQDSFNMTVRPHPDQSQDLCRGDCASPGVAEGVARVIVDPANGIDLEPGEILVAPYTDPAWTPLFPGAAAVIVEVGSFLSHAGTLAREYQIPCLVDVRDATRRIRSGQKLRVNASEGWVQILEDTP